MKLLVMRKILEMRKQNKKPRLGQLIMGLRGEPKQRLATRKKILDLYEYTEEAQMAAQIEKNE